MVSISACHAEDPGSIPGGGVFNAGTTYLQMIVLGLGGDVKQLEFLYLCTIIICMMGGVKQPP